MLSAESTYLKPLLEFRSQLESQLLRILALPASSAASAASSLASVESDRASLKLHLAEILERAKHSLLATFPAGVSGHNVHDYGGQAQLPKQPQSTPRLIQSFSAIHIDGPSPRHTRSPSSSGNDYDNPSRVSSSCSVAPLIAQPVLGKEEKQQPQSSIGISHATNAMMNYPTYNHSHPYPHFSSPNQKPNQSTDPHLSLHSEPSLSHTHNHGHTYNHSHAYPRSLLPSSLMSASVHSHAVEVSVRCLPHQHPATSATSAAIEAVEVFHPSHDHSHSHGMKSNEQTSHPSTETDINTSGSELTVSTGVVSDSKQESSAFAASFCCPELGVTSCELVCPPSCNLASLSPCALPCGFDMGCFDESIYHPLGLSCFSDFDPLCCGKSEPNDRCLIEQCNEECEDSKDDCDLNHTSLASSLCLPMPCDPCNGSSSQTLSSTTIVPASILNACLPYLPHDHDHDASSSAPSTPSNHTHTALNDDNKYLLECKQPMSPTQLLPQQPSQVILPVTSTLSAATATIPSSSSSMVEGVDSKSRLSSSVPSGMTVSCHQCKLKKPIDAVLHCACTDQPNLWTHKKDAGRKKCVKKYCGTCLAKHYDINLATFSGEFICPACTMRCTCAACVKRKNELNETALAVQHQHSHNHTHVTIHSHSLSLHAHSHAQLLTHANLYHRGSCHQCKSSKHMVQLLVCSATTNRRGSNGDGKRLRECKKKFCAACLEKWFGINMAAVKSQDGGNDWICPACRGICPCAACRRKAGGSGAESAATLAEDEGDDDDNDGEEEARVSKRVRHHHHSHSHHPHAHGHSHLHHPHSHSHHHHHLPHTHLHSHSHAGHSHGPAIPALPSQHERAE